MKNFLSNVLTVLLVVSAGAVLALVARRELAEGPALTTVAGPPPDRAVPEWEALAKGRVLGDSAATIRIVEFSDFQCGYCNRVRPELARLRALDPERIAIEYRHFVREEVKPTAFAAAMAAECAGAQGRFSEFHDALFDGQATIGNAAWAKFARTAGVPDIPAFQRCVDEQRFRPAVEQDVQSAEAIGVPGTPAFVFDGKLIVGVSAPERLEPLVRKALAAP
ncbi:MAG TPA: DsbA family protein [Longimicrobium sp.]|nr:DsbA family protein [Longimicrobium sp.]